MRTDRCLRQSGGAWATLAMLLAALILTPGTPTCAQDDNALAKAAQNPVAAMISLPLQNNIFFGAGPHGDTANVLNI